MSNKKLIYSATKKDFDVQYFIASGPGGQHRNKTETACRIKHIPSGLVSESSDHKSQIQNKREAFRKLANKIMLWVELKEKENLPEYKISNETIRTYNEPGDRVVDHRSGKKYSYKQTIGKGDISTIIEDSNKHLIEIKISV